MKKRESPSYQLWQQRVVARRRKRDEAKKAAKQTPPNDLAPPFQRIQAHWSHREIVTVPAAFNFHPTNLDDSREVTMQLQLHVQQGRKVLLNFAETQHISAMALVHLYSEIEKVQQAASDESVVKIPAHGVGTNIASILRDTALLYLTKSGPQPRGHITPIVCGQRDDYLQDIVDFILAKALIDNEITPMQHALAEHMASRALQEAMLNVFHHAHPDDKENHRWWATAIIIQNQLLIAICDRGVGIPSTLPKADFWNTLKPKILIGDDHELIKQAMIYTRSSKAKRQSTQRGLGSRDMQKLVLSAESGYMTVVSGKGYYKLDGTSKKETSYAAKNDFDGTIIQWCLPLHGDHKWSA